MSQSNKGLKMTDTKYNGWTNYATWRVNLEMFDGMDFEDFNTMADDAYEFGQDLLNYAEEVLFSESSNSLMESYARAFLSSVNWTEIAQGMIDTYKDENEESEAENV
jgi:hypothetical protein